MRNRLLLIGLTAVCCTAGMLAVGMFGIGAGATTAGAAASERPVTLRPVTLRPATAPPSTVPPSTVPPAEGKPTASTLPIDPSTGLPVAQGPLAVLPAGCVAPSAPVAVFEGVITDAVASTARFRITRLLAGSLQGYQFGEAVDVRYGDETRFLDVGSAYVVGVGASAADGALVSTVRESAPLFGGDAVVGLNDNDIDCPTLDDPVRTLMPDGASVDTGVLAPLRGNTKSLLGAVLRPVGIALLALLALVIVKHLFFATGRALRDMGAGAPVDRGRRHDAP